MHCEMVAEFRRRKISCRRGCARKDRQERTAVRPLHGQITTRLAPSHWRQKQPRHEFLERLRIDRLDEVKIITRLLRLPFALVLSPARHGDEDDFTAPGPLAEASSDFIAVVFWLVVVVFVLYGTKAV